MTIVDVALHKWRMLDDRRRRVFIGSIILTILLSTLVIYLIASKSKHEPEPDPTPTTTPDPNTSSTTPTTTTTTTTSSSTTTQRMPGARVSSKDGRALASLDGTLITGEHSDTKTIDLPGLSSIEVKPEEQAGRFKVNMVVDDLEISCSFIKTEKALEADHITLSWHEGQLDKQCSLVRKSEDVNFFHSDSTKHYKCFKKMTYDCDANSTEIAHLVIDNFEIEIERAQPVDPANLEFETPSFECPN